MWHDRGSVIHLHADNLDVKYKVGENILYQLGTDGKEIEGALANSFQLIKVE